MEAVSFPLFTSVVPPPAQPAAPEPARSLRRSASVVEPLSPFVPWSAEERAPLSESDTALEPERTLLVELLREPSAVVERLLDPSRLQGLVLSSVGTIVVCTSLFAATSSAARPGVQGWLIPAALTSAKLLLALAASLGPIYAASVLVAARVPLARLVAALLASAATGSLLLAGLAPPLYLLWRLDDEWAGPLMLMGAFLLAGVAAGARIHQVLRMMAEAVTRAALGDEKATLSTEDAQRVGYLARESWVVLAFTLGASFWAFQSLG